MKIRNLNTVEGRRDCYKKGSLTVEAALVLPLFLYFMLTFIYYIQIFTVQEQIQDAVTKMGLNLSKSAYIIKDFPNVEESVSFDFSIFGDEFEFGLEKLAAELASSQVLKLYARKYLDTNQINNSCIKNGFHGISFLNSSLISNDDYIDIVVSYYVDLPIKIFAFDDMQMIQRVRVRCWTGYDVEAVYLTKEENNNGDVMVFITDTGRVYHKKETCSHIKLSVTSVQGLPTGLRNENGAKYYPCESCCKGDLNKLSTFYITTDGTRYHSIRDCSRIKRSVKAISITEIGEKSPCKRCYD